MARSRSISLPVITKGKPAQSAPRARGPARWRTVSLVVVNLAIIAHVLHWSWSGETFARCVLSDATRTLELGEVNPGFLLFALVLAVTALFGRFFCGWLCHMGALQDLCGWIVRLTGARPRLFRSRLLGYVPLALAVYLFVWPTLYRVALAPLAAWLWPGAVQTPAGFPGLSLDLTTRDLWDGLPSLWVAIPFLLVCGAGMVYFLGARGLCRYGCPYGGLLLPADHLAPVRVRVDPTRCDQCGLCTKACTSGVRVHDEIRVHAAVLDHNCIRSLDCLSACPSHALWIGAGLPALGHRGQPRRYDLTWGEELLCTGAALSVFFVSRGLYGFTPMLMAASLAVLAGFITWKTMRVLRDPNVRLGAFVLRQSGRLTKAGVTYLVIAALLVLLNLQSASVRLSLWAADRFDQRISVGLADAIAGRATASQREDAARALRWYRAALPIGEGGFALTSSPGVDVRLAWLLLVLDQRAQAEACLRTALERRPGDGLLQSLGTLLSATGRDAEAISLLQAHASTQFGWTESRQMLTSLWMMSGRADDAERLHREALAHDADDPDALRMLGRVIIARGQTDEGLRYLRKSAAVAPRTPAPTSDLATALFQAGRPDDALTVLAEFARARPAARDMMASLGSKMLEAAGRADEVPAWHDRLR